MSDRKTVYFCGLDRVGKSTTRKIYSEQSGQKNITFDRSPIDNLVYDEIVRGCIHNDVYIENFINDFFPNSDNYIVFLTINNEEINKRSEETEGITYNKEFLNDTVKCFNKYFKFLKKKVKVIKIKCEKKTPFQIALMVKRKIGD